MMILPLQLAHLMNLVEGMGITTVEAFLTASKIK